MSAKVRFALWGSDRFETNTFSMFYSTDTTVIYVGVKHEYHGNSTDETSEGQSFHNPLTFGC